MKFFCIVYTNPASGKKASYFVNFQYFYDPKDLCNGSVFCRTNGGRLFCDLEEAKEILDKIKDSNFSIYELNNDDIEILGDIWHYKPNSPDAAYL